MYARHSSRSVSGTTQLGIAIGALLTGASLMYLFDPRSGRRRRASLGGQVNRGLRQTREFAQKVRVDAENRARGLYEQSRAALDRSPIDDDILAERARAALGRLCSHPGALQITCAAQIIHVSGDILSDQVKRVLHGLRNVRGVKDLVNELIVHESAESVPALQGEARTLDPALPEYLQESWSPAPRVLAGAVGVGLIASSLGSSRLNASTATLGLAGAAILLRAISNRSFARLIGWGAGAEDSLIQKARQALTQAGELMQPTSPEESKAETIVHH